MSIDEGTTGLRGPGGQDLREQDLRERALRQLKKRADFRGHVLVYLLFNTFLVVIWAVTGHHFFWPVFVIVGWGIAVAMNAWDVYGVGEPDETRIQREMERLQRRA